MGLPISFKMALLLLVGIGLGSAVPSGPGYIGVYQFVGVTVLTPFGIHRADAVAFVLVSEVIQALVFGLWGMLGLRSIPQDAAGRGNAPIRAMLQPGQCSKLG